MNHDPAKLARVKTILIETLKGVDDGEGVIRIHRIYTQRALDEVVVELIEAVEKEDS